MKVEMHVDWFELIAETALEREILATWRRRTPAIHHAEAMPPRSRGGGKLEWPETLAIEFLTKEDR